MFNNKFREFPLCFHRLRSEKFRRILRDLAKQQLWSIILELSLSLLHKTSALSKSPSGGAKCLMAYFSLNFSFPCTEDSSICSKSSFPSKLKATNGYKNCSKVSTVPDPAAHVNMCRCFYVSGAREIVTTFVVHTVKNTGNLRLMHKKFLIFT